MAGLISALNYYDMIYSYVLAFPVKAMLVTSDFTYDPELHEFRSSIFNEVSGTGYTAGGIALPEADVLLDAVNNAVEFVADEVDFGTLTIPDIGSMIVYRSTGVAATDRVLAGFPFPTVSRNAESFVFTWDEPSNADPSFGTVVRFNY